VRPRKVGGPFYFAQAKGFVNRDFGSAASFPSRLLNKGPSLLFNLENCKGVVSCSRNFIANRGEIAVRIIRACREKGVATVGRLFQGRRRGLHVALADQSVCVSGPLRPLKAT
jgi:hypothetical protein